MLANIMEQLHVLARVRADDLGQPDKKQLRFNEIVSVAMTFYPNNMNAGVIELVESCDKGSPLYVQGAPMWRVLREQYGWMTE